MLLRTQTRVISSLNAVKIACISESVNRILTVKWTDGVAGKFPLIWLRDCSPDISTYTISPAMTARNLTMNEFDVEQSPQNITLDNDREELVIDWGGVESRFSSSWLRMRNPSDELAKQKRREVYLFPETTWGRDEIERNLKTFSHNDVLNDDKSTQSLHDFLEAVCLDGIAILKNGPIGTRTAVEDIGKRIGFIHRTHFGKIFEVSTKAEASNMAYASNGGLPLHTDFPSMSHPPQLQMLHMVERAAEGGNSIFVDGFHVAEQLRVERPETFDILTKHDMEYIEEGYDVHEGPDGQPNRFEFDMCARHRTIKLDERDRVIKIQFGNAMRSWFYDCRPENVQDIYRQVVNPQIFFICHQYLHMNHKTTLDF
uniref:TauD domain-containing protein n=1 Tax=Heterorhabditis bacteriophora TaxID=37862 RepID=A0A1I7XU42_HETBA